MRFFSGLALAERASHLAISDRIEDLMAQLVVSTEVFTADHNRMLDRVFQFADVPRPWISNEKLAGFRRDAPHRTFHLGPQLPQEVFRQGWYIFSALA